MYKTCPTCKKEFPKPVNESKKNWETRHIYCSKKCTITRVILSCWECGIEFEVRNYRKNIAHFCSKDCASQYKDEGKRTEDKKIRQSAKYKAWRTLVFERDNYTCQFCNKIGGYLHADHIKPFALYIELRFEVSNGRTLCIPCHKKTGTWGRGAIYRKRCIASA
jgi:hypothetical protein